MKKTFQKYNLIVFAQLELRQGFYMVILRYINRSLTKLQTLDLLSAINTPTYSLAKYLNPILSPLTTNEFTGKNSFNFAEDVVHYDHNLYMASLDVESLFTNIPLEETIKNCDNDLRIAQNGNN